MSINLKSANKNDIDYFFSLRKFNSNKFSFIKNKDFEYKDHKNWFMKSLNNINNLMYVVKLNKLQCGYVRLDKKSKDYFISICIEKKFRRKGNWFKSFKFNRKKNKQCRNYNCFSKQKKF